MPMTTKERILETAQRRVMESGFTGTTVDALLDEVGVSKGAFFHHFPSKAALGKALVERYAKADLDLLDRFLAQAETRTDDPAAQLIEVLHLYENLVAEITDNQPGCLFVSFIFEVVPDGTDIREIISESVMAWRRRILDKLEAAAARRVPRVAVDLPSLADQFFTVFEGGFVLVRVSRDRDALRAQLAHLRQYIGLLFGD